MYISPFVDTAKERRLPSRGEYCSPISANGSAPTNIIIPVTRYRARSTPECNSWFQIIVYSRAWDLDQAQIALDVNLSAAYDINNNGISARSSSLILPDIIGVCRVQHR